MMENSNAFNNNNTTWEQIIIITKFTFNKKVTLFDKIAHF